MSKQQPKQDLPKPRVRAVAIEQEPFGWSVVELELSQDELEACTVTKREAQPLAIAEGLLLRWLEDGRT